VAISWKKVLLSGGAYSDLSDSGKLGTGSTQVAIGNHTHAYLGLGGGILTGDLVISQSRTLKFYDTNTEAYVNVDARDDGDTSTLHKFRHKKANGTYDTYKEQWYDGSTYHPVTMEPTGLKVDGTLVSMDGHSHSINGGDWSGADLAIVDGGTGASSAATARTNLSVDSSGEVDTKVATKLGLTANAVSATKLNNINTTFSGVYPMVVNVGGTIYSHAGIQFTGANSSLAVDGPMFGKKIPASSVWMVADIGANISLELGQNTTGGVGSIKMWSYTADQFAFLRPSNGNLHIDSTQGKFYFNWDDAIHGASKAGQILLGNASGSAGITLNSSSASIFTNSISWSGGTSGNANTAYSHSQATHAPTGAQAHIAPTKAEVENVLTGAITSHSHTDANTWRGIDDTPVNGQTSESISSNWAFDHNAGTGNGKHVPPSNQEQGDFLRSDGIWATPPDNNTVYSHPANHAISVITGLQTALDGKSATSHEHTNIKGSTSNLDTMANYEGASRFFHQSFSAGATGEPNTNDNANSVLTSVQHSGGYTAQLSFSSDGNMYHRDNPSSNVGTWRKVWTEGNFNPSNYALTHSHPYNNYVHPTTSGNKHIPSGGSGGQILRYSGDGAVAWETPSWNNYVHPANHAISVITGLQTALDGKSATSHSHSLVGGVMGGNALDISGAVNTIGSGAGAVNI